MIEKLSMVTRIVEDQDEAVAFYTEKLGFALKRDRSGPHGRFVTVAPQADENVELILVSPDMLDDETDDAETRTDVIGSNGSLIYHVDGIEETFQSLEERGIEFLGEPEEMPWGTQAVAVDPDGNKIVIQESVVANAF